MNRLTKIITALEPLQQAVKNHPTQQQLFVMATVLSSLEEEQISKAILKAICSCTFWPSPAEVLAFVDESDELGETEWSIIMNHIQRFGCNSDVKINLSQEGIKALESIGGLRKIGMSDENQSHFFAKDFKKSRKIFAKRSQEKMIFSNPLLTKKIEQAFIDATDDIDGIVSTVAQLKGF
jgi:hypothetical protein